MKTEEWRVVEGYEGIYAVSDAGNVMSMNYQASGLPGLLTPLTNSRYARVCLYKKGIQMQCRTIHAMVLAAFVGPRPADLDINHIDGDPFNNALENLEYCTKSHNMKHAHATGLQSNKGENHSQAKLDDNLVRLIRILSECGWKTAALARLFGLHDGAAGRVISGKRWPHVPMEGKSMNVKLGAQLGGQAAKNRLSAG